MRIYIHSAPDDLAIAQRLADLVAQQPAVSGNPNSTVTVAAPTDTATAERLIDANTAIVFLLSLNVVQKDESYQSWLADLLEYALLASDPEGAKLVVDANIDRVIFGEDSRLRVALSYTRVEHPLLGYSRGSLDEELPRFAQKIAEYSTWKFYQRHGKRGFLPEAWLPTSPSDEESDGNAWFGIEQERGEESLAEPPRRTQAPAPPGTVGGVPAPQPPAPPSEATGGPPEGAPAGGAPITSPAPYPDQAQQERRKEAPRQRGEAALSTGEVSTLQFSAYHPNTV